MNQTFTIKAQGRRLPGFFRMFILIYLFLICAFPFDLFAQGGSFTISVKKTPILEVFKLMKVQEPGLDFFYSDDEFDTSRKIDVNVIGASLGELMQLILGNRYSHQLIDGHLVIKPIIQVNSLRNAQVVTGKVIGEDGIALPGVAVNAVLSKSTTVTDLDGRYTIHTHDDDILRFTSIGFQKQEVRVKDNTVLNIILKEDVAFLNEVVVTGYQTLQRKNTTGAYAVIGEKEISGRNNITLDRLLEGTVPGLSVYKDDKGQNDLRIRGGSSLRAGTQPLFVIDGFVSKIVPDINEIQSITVLKDAAAAAVWGSQAANGVVVITTKKGKPGKLQINYSGNARIANRPDYSQLRRVEASDLIDYQKEQFDKGYIIPEIFDGSKSGYSTSIGIFNDYKRGDISLQERDSKLAALAGLSNRDQVNQYLLRPSVSQSHFLSFSGGSDKMQYFLSGNYKSESAGTMGSNSDAMTINSRNNYEVSSFLNLTSDISATFTSGKTGYENIQTEIRNLMPYQLLLDAQGKYIYDYSGFNKRENDRLTKLGYLDNGFNLLEENRNSNNTNSGWGLKTRIGANWKIIKGLTLNNDFLYEKNTSTGKNLYGQNGYTARSLINYMTSTDAADKLVFNIPKGDILDLNTQNYKNYAFRNQLNYANTFNGKHYINVIGGFDLRKTVADGSKNRKLGYNDELLSNQNIDAKQLASTGIVWWDGDQHNYDPSYYEDFSFNDTREYSFYSTAAYTYDDRYTLSASYRTDHSNLFGADPKFRKTPLWSFGGNWNISNEHFFHSDLISNLGLRATYGLTGNFDRDNSTTTFLVAKRFFNTIANDYVARLQTPPNPKLRWERSKTFNLGTDISLLKSRFSLSVDYYRKNSYDLLGSQDLDPTVGLTNASINAASMVNNGVEMSLKAGIIEHTDFGWTSTLNFGYNQNKVTSNRITDTDPAINRPNGTVQFLEGYARDAVWSYKWAGLDNTGRPMVYDGSGNKIYIPNVGSLDYSGTSRPKLSGGWSNEFRYKGFNALIFMVFNYGHVGRREMPNMYGYDWSGAYNNQVAQRWRVPGDENHTDIPAIPDFENLSDDYSRAATLSSNSIFNASFIRLREVQLGYTFNAAFLRGTPFKSIRLVAQMNNLYLFKANKYGIDPEAVNSGTYVLPEPLTTTFGLNISL